LIANAAAAPPPLRSRRATLYVDGRFLHDRDGHQIVLRGVNLPLLDNYQFPGSDHIDEVAKTGANAIRIQWYWHYGDPARPAYTIADLDGVLARCKAAGMIPIVQLADLTCTSDPGQLDSKIIPWWISPETVSVLNKHADYLVINLANEVGFYHWTGDENAALSAYVAAYKAALAKIRRAGLAMPVMIDAPDCGTSLDAFTTASATLVTADPIKNTLFSVHAYWAGAGKDYTAVLSNCAKAGLPVICGEIANKQDNTDDPNNPNSYFDLDGSHHNTAPPSGFTYQALLHALLGEQIGWLAWSWGPDKCADRMLSSNYSFAALTPYGSDIVNNPAYGLRATAVRVKG
jgi:mannan endo-1,4-beta-mannosidase